jgi:hypothetical protein
MDALIPLAFSTALGGGLGILYIVLLLVLGVMSIRRGHWIMFVMGIFIPLFWIIGAIMPPTKSAREAGR